MRDDSRQGDSPDGRSSQPGAPPTPRCDVVTIRRAIQAGELRALRLGRHGDYRIPVDALEKWLRPAQPEQNPYAVHVHELYGPLRSRHPGPTPAPTHPISAFELLRDVWGIRTNGIRTRTADSHASRLRRKLDAAGARDVIVNDWGVVGAVASDVRKWREVAWLLSFRASTRMVARCCSETFVDFVGTTGAR
jgi:excisionase family DNA binding protein